MLQTRPACKSRSFPSFIPVSSWHRGGKSRVHLAVRSRIQGSGTQWVDLRLWQNDLRIAPRESDNGRQSPTCRRPYRTIRYLLPSRDSSALAGSFCRVHWQPHTGLMHADETELMVISFVPSRVPVEARVAVERHKAGLVLCDRLGEQASYPDLCA